MPAALLARRLRSRLWCQKQVVAGDRGRWVKPDMFTSATVFAIPSSLIASMNFTLGDWYLALVSFSLAVLALVLLYRRLSLFVRSVCVTGKLTGWHESPEIGESRGISYWHPKVAFVALDGVTYEIIASAGFNPKPKMELGLPMPIRYDPARPDKAKVNSILHFWSPPVVLFILSACAAFALVKRTGIF